MCGVYNVIISNMLRVNMSTDLSVCVNQIISSVPMEMYWVLFKSRLITIQDLDYTRSVYATIMLILQFLYTVYVCDQVYPCPHTTFTLSLCCHD